MSFNILNSPIKDLMYGNLLPKHDERGYNERVFCIYEFNNIFKFNKNIVQVNRSLSKNRGTIRGCHFQMPPFLETKIIFCTKGRLFDVGVDLRKNSETYLKYFSLELSPENKKFLIVPDGFAHGFQTLEENTEIFYLVTQRYSPSHDNGINPFDPLVNIKWPLKCSNISDKDKQKEFISEIDFSGLEVE